MTSRGRQDKRHIGLRSHDPEGGRYLGTPPAAREAPAIVGTSPLDLPAGTRYNTSDLERFAPLAGFGLSTYGRF
jgi:hypothetical protein